MHDQLENFEGNKVWH
jgi:hypothetical protein